MRTRTPALTSASVLLAVGIAGCSDMGPWGDGTISSPATPSTAPNRDNTTTATPFAAAEFVDGEYSATGWYGSLPSHQDVTVGVEDGAITDVEITTPAEDETSLGYQQRFAAALPEAVIGKDIADIRVDRLAGSSGCSEGFMNALAKIKEAAAA
ncbi:hypothetical protein [Glaciihabitans sp. dw_435]|uniref:FMN-binding protein n=1 Tax=Glaciihabitans sp. dw_435 TaxID=2720081 RepID=UPI001BD2CC5C|nr:hypothetical protein [Glaciihabitans sp. dw_435]